MRNVLVTRWVGLLLGLLPFVWVFSASAHAEVNLSSVSWATLQANDDITAQILDSIFPMDGNTQTTTGLMLQWFTAYVALIASVWIFYSIIIQIHKTAESGKVFSASFSGWVPIRVIGAIIMMFPVTSNGGYSLGQTLIMRSAKASIGMARTLKDVVVDNVGPKALPLSTPIIPGSRQIVQGIINSELCRSLINKASNNSNLVPEPTITGGEGMTDRVTVTYDMAYGDSFNVPVCGKISMASPNRALSPQFNLTTIDFSEEGAMQLSALRQVISHIRPSVDHIATSMWQTRDMTVLKSLDSVFTTQSTFFSAQLTAIASSAVSKIRQAGSNSGNNDSGVTLLKNMGWTGLGAYYLEISRLNSEVQSVAAITPSTQRPSWQGTGSYLQSDLTPFFMAINGYMAKQDEMLAASDEAYAPSASPRMFENATISQEPMGLLDKVLRYMGLSEATFRAIMNYLIMPSSGSGWTDPLSSMIGLGHFLIDLALLVIGASAIASSATASLAAGAASLLTGDVAGAAAGTAAAGLSGVVSALLIPIFTGAFLLLGPGVTLAYILPMTPCLFWYAGVAGWLVIVVEALVAAPIWFLAHMTFAGDGVHGKGIRGYEVLFSIIFRPSIMVVGMICSYSIFSGLSWIWMKSFVVAAGFVFDHGYLINNLIGILVLMCLYVGAEMTTATLSFRLISTLPHHLPDMAGFRAVGRVDSDAYVQSSQEPAKSSVASLGDIIKSDNTFPNGGGGGPNDGPPPPPGGAPAMDSTTAAQMSTSSFKDA
jgi:conjugal transfer/type IV secretion protein DotA/TraY